MGKTIYVAYDNKTRNLVLGYFDETKFNDKLIKYAKEKSGLSDDIEVLEWIDKNLTQDAVEGTPRLRM